MDLQELSYKVGSANAQAIKSGKPPKKKEKKAPTDAFIISLNKASPETAAALGTQMGYKAKEQTLSPIDKNQEIAEQQAIMNDLGPENGYYDTFFGYRKAPVQDALNLNQDQTIIGKSLDVLSRPMDMVVGALTSMQTEEKGDTWDYMVYGLTAEVDPLTGERYVDGAESWLEGMEWYQNAGDLTQFSTELFTEIAVDPLTYTKQIAKGVGAVASLWIPGVNPVRHKAIGNATTAITGTSVLDNTTDAAKATDTSEKAYQAKSEFNTLRQMAGIDDNVNNTFKNLAGKMFNKSHNIDKVINKQINSVENIIGSEIYNFQKMIVEPMAQNPNIDMEEITKIIEGNSRAIKGDELVSMINSMTRAQIDEMANTPDGKPTFNDMAYDGTQNDLYFVIDDTAEAKSSFKKSLNTIAKRMNENVKGSNLRFQIQRTGGNDGVAKYGVRVDGLKDKGLTDEEKKFLNDNKQYAIDMKFENNQTNVASPDMLEARTTLSNGWDLTINRINYRLKAAGLTGYEETLKELTEGYWRNDSSYMPHIVDKSGGRIKKKGPTKSFSKNKKSQENYVLPAKLTQMESQRYIGPISYLNKVLGEENQFITDAAEAFVLKGNSFNKDIAVNLALKNLLSSGYMNNRILPTTKALKKQVAEQGKYQSLSLNGIVNTWGVDKNSVIKMLQDEGIITGDDLSKYHLYLTQEEKDILDTSKVLGKDEEIRQITNAYDKGLSWIKRGLLMSFGYFMRNMIGGTINMNMAGMRVDEIGSYLKKANKTMEMDKRARDKINDIDNPAKSFDTAALTPEELEAYTTMEEMRANGLTAEQRISGELQGELNFDRKITPKAISNWWLGTSLKFENPQRIATYMWAKDMSKKGKTDKFSSAILGWGGKNMNGLTPQEHGEKVLKASLFDYNDLSKFEQEKMKRIMPFYTFARKNTEWVVSNLFMDPAKVTKADKFYDAILESQGITEEDIDPNAQRNGWVPLKLAGDDGEIVYLKSGGQTMQGLEMLNPKEAVTTLMTSNPFVNIILGLTTGQDLWAVTQGYHNSEYTIVNAFEDAGLGTMMTAAAAFGESLSGALEGTSDIDIVDMIPSMFKVQDVEQVEGYQKAEQTEQEKEFQENIADALGFQTVEQEEETTNKQEGVLDAIGIERDLRTKKFTMRYQDNADAMLDKSKASIQANEELRKAIVDYIKQTMEV